MAEEIHVLSAIRPAKSARPCVRVRQRNGRSDAAILQSDPHEDRRSCLELGSDHRAHLSFRVMKPADLFGVLVRTSALPLVWWGFVQLGTAISIRVQVPDPEGGVKMYCGWGVLYVVAGFCVLLRADNIVRLAYRSENREIQTDATTNF